MPKYSKEAKEKHNELMTILYDYVNEEVDKHDYGKFVNRLKTLLPPLHLKVSNNINDIIDQLEKLGKVSPGNYSALKEKFRGIDQRWVDLIEEHEGPIQALIRDDGLPSSTSDAVIDIPNTKRRNEDRPDTATKKIRQDRLPSYEKRDSQTGLMVIINFNKNREGSGRDVYKLEKFFTETLNFEVKRRDDPSKDNLNAFLVETRNKLNTLDAREKYHCLFIVVMSHGDKDGIVTNDNERINLDDIFFHFKNEQFQCFADKPKVFLVQACRGSDEQGTVDVPDEWPEDIGDVVGQLSVPVDAHILIAYATTPGNKAFRRLYSEIGSWFIHALIERFSDMYTDCHVEDMLISVKQSLAEDERFKTSTGKKQMPCTWSTLTKRLYL